jgi:glyceraldehyde 3-phosphate dehydrogenase
MVNVAINGFGRIGRAAAKIALESSVMNLVAINDLGDIATLAHLLKYDSCYGIYEKEVGYKDNELIVNTHNIRFFLEKDPKDLPWKALEVDVVLEATGVFLTKESAKGHITAGARKVVLSAPPKDDSVPIYVIGSNEKKYKGEDIVSNASCTTNCIAPIMKVLDDVFGIEKSMMTTVHSYTADQSLVDGPHKDLRRARAAAINIIPTTTGAAKATGKTIKSLEGRFDGLSVRVPTPIVSLSDITALVGKRVDLEIINKVLTDASESTHQGIIVASEEPLVSSDLIKNPASAIADLTLTNVVAGDLIKVVAWYDNEWGYSNRLVELAELIATKR